MAIVDDYDSWKENEFHREVAKVLHYDPNDLSIQNIFFDDNALEEDDCIVDMRNIITQDIVPYKQFINRSAVLVNPSRAIMEPDYFIKLIEMAEQNTTKHIEKL